MSADAAQRRTLWFADEDAVIADVERLRRRGYTKLGNWNLPQMTWHLASLIEKFLNPPADPVAPLTPAQHAMKIGFVDYCNQNRALPPHATNAGPFTPAADVGEQEIDNFISQFRRLKEYPHAMVEMGPIGAVKIDECRQVHLVHAEHHLSFLVPNGPQRRERLRYHDTGELIDDVQRLSRGYSQVGAWSLSQILFHLTVVMRNRMRPGPFPADTPEQIARRPIVERVLKVGIIPIGRVAPPPVAPPDDCGPEKNALDTFVTTVDEFNRFPGPLAPHPMFGTLTDAQARQLNLIHSAHHLSYLVPH